MSRWSPVEKFLADHAVALSWGVAPVILLAAASIVMERDSKVLIGIGSTGAMLAFWARLLRSERESRGE